ncbi:hypothetical protein ACHWQZ_G005997 [Mnemiopsis leidyi]
MSKKRWQVFPGKNRFFCGGRIIMAKQINVFFVTLILLLGVCVLFFVFDCEYLSQKVHWLVPVIAGVLLAFTLLFLFRTSFSDPGILPRATGDEALFNDRGADNNVDLTQSSANFRNPPRTKDVQVNGETVKLKYCFTCKIFRPPRASHCSMCDNCIERFDHHCPWVGNCVGKRNYRYFYLMIVTITILCIYVLAFSIAHIVMLSREKENTLITAMSETPASVIEALIAFFAVWSVLGLAGFHSYLAGTNQTTNEEIKGSWAQRHGEVVRNPYTTNNCCGNFTKILCGPSYTSLLRLREDKNKEKRDMEEVKKKIEKLMFEQQNNSNSQGHWTNSQPHNGIPVDHTDLQTQLPRTPTPS